jgi:hypothetical protein
MSIYIKNEGVDEVVNTTTPQNLQQQDFQELQNKHMAREGDALEDLVRSTACYQS